MILGAGWRSIGPHAGSSEPGVGEADSHFLWGWGDSFITLDKAVGFQSKNFILYIEHTVFSSEIDTIL